MQIVFFDVKTRQKVELTEAQVKKTKYERKLANGKTQVRYALRGTYEGRKLTEFVSEADWMKIEAPME